MAIESVCAGCGNRLSVADENAGKRARCPACGHIYTVPIRGTENEGPGLHGTGLPPDAFASHDAREPAGFSSKADAAGYGDSDAFGHTSDDAASLQGEDRTDGDPQAGRYWMRAVDGTEYGPVDRQTLQRWFREGRVGPGYQLRQSRYENWRPADDFRAAVGRPSDNPFSSSAHDPNPYQPVASTIPAQSYPQPDQSALILVMGVLGIFCCPVFGIVAWVMGHQALNAIQAGQANPNSKGLVRVGYYLGIAAVIIFVISSGRMILQIIN